MKKTARHIHITGLVQGVGFRPFVYRHAKRYGLSGWVRNHAAGVDVVIEGSTRRCNQFIRSLKKDAPIASLISMLVETKAEPENLSDFQIRPSINGYEQITDISPDIAVCNECLMDIKQQHRRLSYPFTNCTHCGPRFSIITNIPYDRSATSMKKFIMCEECMKEYTNVHDRRFHAQPVSCIHCGPAYKWISKSGTIESRQECFTRLYSELKTGKIIALKSTGGFQLICDASNPEAVNRLRRIKQRHSRPFAIMFKNIEELKKHTYINREQKKYLQSWQRPVVILKDKSSYFTEVNPGYTTIGAILPYTPLHHIIMENSDIPAMVFTSANVKGSPLIFENDRALELLKQKGCDAVLLHNRAVINSQDDSIVKIHDHGPCIIRRARGFTPSPVVLKFEVENILAVGADFKNSFCIGKDRRAIMSQYMGNLEDYEVLQRFTNSINKISKLFKFKPTIIAHDLHPDYHSSGHALKIAEQHAIPEERIIGVQHHHAHIASVLAEHGINEAVIGVAFDGTGYGEDGRIWGSEFMICDRIQYQRKYHLDYFPLPGGDKAVKEPWRLAVALGYRAFGKNFPDFPLEFQKHIPKEKQKNIIKAIDNNVNISWSCGAGRLFDAIAAITNITHYAEFEGEGPLKLENIHKTSEDYYHIPLQNNAFSPDILIRATINDLLAGIPVSEISGRFHNSIINMVLVGVNRIAMETGLNKVALSGGVFQNKIITNSIYQKLYAQGFQVYVNQQVPCNDGGIALGQMAVAQQLAQNQI